MDDSSPESPPILNKSVFRIAFNSRWREPLKMPKLQRFVAALVAAFLLNPLLACAAAPAKEALFAIQDMRESADRFLTSLDSSQKAKAIFQFKDDERLNWHFIPRERKGLSFKEMQAFQRPLGMALVNSALSHRGQMKTAAIMSLEQILLELEQGKGPKRDPEMYFLSFFGTPSANQTWGWRIEGHHLAMNFTLAHGTEVSATPSFLGSNPATVKEGPRAGLRVLAAEEDLGRHLLKSLNPTQSKQAIFASAAPKDIFTAADRKAKQLEPQGILASALNETQLGGLKALIREYAGRLRPELAAVSMQKIEKNGWKNIRFAWAGGTEPGEGHYYRVQGATFLLEYDNVQNNNNHVHAVWRDFDGDFGEDILAQHHSETPHAK